MPVVMVEASELSRLEWNAPGAEAIQRAFTAAAPLLRWGAWVGPVRVTREAVLGSGFVTHVAVPFEYPDTLRDRPEYLYQQIRTNLGAELQRVSSDFSPPSVTPYTTGLNGPLDAWRSGAAANTQTRDTFPTGAGRVDPIENPETPAGQHPTSAGEAVAHVVEAVAIVGAIGGAAFLAVEAAPAVAAFFAGRRSGR